MSVCVDPRPAAACRPARRSANTSPKRVSIPNSDSLGAATISAWAGAGQVGLACSGFGTSSRGSLTSSGSDTRGTQPPKKRSSFFEKCSRSIVGSCRSTVGTPDTTERPTTPRSLDDPLFQQLKAGFSESVSYAYDITEPNVIFTDDPDDDFEWPKTSEEAAKFWVVVIDYHFWRPGRGWQLEE